MAGNRRNPLPDSEFVPTDEMMEDITRALQNSFRSIMQGQDIEDIFALRETDDLSFLIGIKERFVDNLERIKLGALEIMEFGGDEYVYSIPDADEDVHRTMESSRKQLTIVVVGLEAMVARDRGHSSRDNRRGTSADSESLFENIREALHDLEDGLINSARVTPQGEEIEVTRELRENIKKAVRDSFDCLAVEKKVEETCELRETNPLAFKAGIIIHFLLNMARIEREVFKIEKFCRKKDVLVELSFAEDGFHRDMDSARKGVEKIVELLSAMKKNLRKPRDSLHEPSTSAREDLR